MPTESPKLFQLHWQNRANIEETEFVAQGEFTAADDVHAWVMDVIGRRAREMPEGWMPLIVAEGSKYFALQPAAMPRRGGNRREFL